jgi:enoyl-CoA hydratase/carnithine racemase
MFNTGSMNRRAAPVLPATLRFERDGEVGVLALARPAKRNALDDATVAGIGAFFASVPDGVRAVVLCGDGPHFSAGLDLSDISERDAIEGISHSMAWHRAFEAIEYGTVPVVAALHGAVVGGGLELAAAAHVRVADATAFYALPEGTRGIFLGGGGSVRIPRLIGTARVIDMMLTGRVYDAAGGERIGLTQYTVPAGEARAKAVELARRIAANAPMSNFAVLHALPRNGEGTRAAGYLNEALMASIAQSAPEAKARVAAFLQKRAAKVEAPS